MMVMKRMIVPALLLLIMMAACKEKTETTASGYTFKFVKKSGAPIAKPGEVLIMSMAIVDQKDSAWYDNRKTDYPELVRIQDEMLRSGEHGVVESFRLLAKGDSILFPMKAKDLFTMVWRMPVPEYVDPESTFTFQIGCMDVTDEPGAIKFRAKCDSVHNEKLKVQMEAEAKERDAREAELVEYYKVQLVKDGTIIDGFLKGKNMQAKTTESGLRYVIKKQGSGQPPVAGDYVNVKYAGQFLDGREFDSGEIPFAVGTGQVIKGWDEILMTMAPGTALTVFIPSPLAYGKYGRPPVIPQDAILQFDMELLSVKKP